MRRFVLCIVLMGTFASNVVEHVEGAIQWTVAAGGNGHVYDLVWTQPPNLITWSEAETAAGGMFFDSYQGHLATVTSAAENAFLRDNFVGQWEGPGNTVWIGLTDRTTENDFEWITGESSSYTNWAPNSPNSYFGPGDDFVGYWLPFGPSGEREFLWNDFPNDWDVGSPTQRVGYFVEFAVPEPTSLIIVWSLLATLCFTTNRRRRRA